MLIARELKTFIERARADESDEDQEVIEDHDHVDEDNLEEQFDRIMENLPDGTILPGK